MNIPVAIPEIKSLTPLTGKPCSYRAFVCQHSYKILEFFMPNMTKEAIY